MPLQIQDSTWHINNVRPFLMSPSTLKNATSEYILLAHSIQPNRSSKTLYDPCKCLSYEVPISRHGTSSDFMHIAAWETARSSFWYFIPHIGRYIYMMCTLRLDKPPRFHYIICMFLLVSNHFAFNLVC